MQMGNIFGNWEKCDYIVKIRYTFGNISKYMNIYGPFIAICSITISHTMVWPSTHCPEEKISTKLGKATKPVCKQNKILQIRPRKNITDIIFADIETIDLFVCLPISYLWTSANIANISQVILYVNIS